MAAAARPRPDSKTVWKLAVRLPTLTASITPVIVGSAVAVKEDVFDLLPALAALFAAVCLQVAANLANDVFDFKRGADNVGTRLGPPRASSSGWLSTRQLFAAMWTVVGLAFVAGIYLAFVGGWPIVVVGLVSIVAAIAYTGGPFPLAYHGLGDVAAFFFFGIVAVTGTYYLQADDIPGVALLAAIPVGCTVTAILVVNNLRDIAGDCLARKWTVAVFLGDRLTRVWYGLLVGAAFAVAPRDDPGDGPAVARGRHPGRDPRRSWTGARRAVWHGGPGPKPAAEGHGEAQSGPRARLRGRARRLVVPVRFWARISLTPSLNQLSFGCR